jgi:hypothetical protein
LVDQSATPERDLELATINASLENERRLIAAGKVQRWETVKWVVTVNGALAGFALTLLNLAHAPPLCLLVGGLAAFVSYVGCDLLRHYNDQRLLGARRAAWLLEEHLESEFGIDVRGISQLPRAEPSQDQDGEEVRSFRRVIIWSAVPALLVAAWAVYRVYPQLLAV